MRRHIKHACDYCKRRKAKCDGESPQCSNCRALGLECEYSIPRAKRGPKPRASLVPAGSSPQIQDQSPGRPQLQENGLSEPSDGRSPSTANSFSTSLAFSATSASPATGWQGELVHTSRQTYDPLGVHDHFTTRAEQLGIPIEQTVRSCLRLLVEVGYPICPVYEPANLMQKMSLVLPTARNQFTTASHGAPPSLIPGGKDLSSSGPSLEDMRGFSLLTALMASLSLYSCRNDPNRRLEPGMQAIVSLFLECSQSMLLCFEELDISNPTTDSIIIRMLQSAVLHGQGKNRMSRFVLGQALRLVVDICLFEESSMKNLPATEAQIRRNLFWALYAADKSLSLLNNYPPTLHNHLTDPKHVELMPDGSPVRLLRGVMAPSSEERLRSGFDLSNQQWLVAGDIVRDLDLLSRFGAKFTPGEGNISFLENAITQNYMKFCSLLDNMPPWLLDPGSHVIESSFGCDVESEGETTFQSRCFWIQRANLIVNFHCLRLILMGKAFEQGHADLFGLTENRAMFDLRNTEVASEMLKDVAKIPLSALSSNGEAMVEKLRQVGVILLRIGARDSNEAIAVRAKSLFSTLLDHIARLNSKASDNLDGEAP